MDQKTQAIALEKIAPTVRLGTLNDLNQVVAIHKQAFSNTFGSKLGSSYLRAFYKWFFCEASAVCFVAASEAQLLGYVVGCQSAKQYYEQFYGARQKSLLWAAVCGLLENPLAIIHFRRALPMIAPLCQNVVRKFRAGSQRTSESQVSSASEVTCAVLNVIAVHPSALGTSVAKTLLHKFEAAIYERGVSCIQLSVSKTNTRAIRFYEREGWQLQDETELNFIYITRLSC